ncbi:apolipoprotein N-acyltransferase [Acidovorax sp. DW039]|uniref:apolipoprotein N-acyltransferase n=1 Tax=Acidovorax sp. DW039 TaxID=3095606 RepID=UPI00308E077F|nr:apolipoprotein N-acyltransferase [Acidovorax sp. DW039]
MAGRRHPDRGLVAVSDLLWSALAGGAQAASLALPGSGQPVWWLQCLSMVMLAALLQRPQGGWHRAALLGFVFAWAWLGGTFWWLFISLHTYGGLAAVLAVAAVAGLAAFLALYYAAASAVFCRLVPMNKALAAIIFAALWMLADLARGTWFTGFPWGAGGYAHVEGPLSALPRYIGVYGTGAVSAGLAMALVQLQWRDARRAGPWLAALLLAALGVGATLDRHCAVQLCHTPSQAPAPPLGMALLQGNIPQDEKFEQGSGVPLALRWYAEQLKAETASLVVAPETAIPLLPQQLIPGYLEGLQARYTQGPQAALVGIPLGSERQGYTNSVVGWRPSEVPAAAAPQYVYNKHHLVPFGEFIPPLFKWFTEMLNIPLGDFNRGTVGQPSFAWAGQRIAPNICYEDLFGEELAARFVNPAEAPTILVNFSNIGWFGNTLAIDQHLNISRMRALELERPMVRATNTGATAIIDHRGVVTHLLERHTRGVLRGEVHGRGAGVSVGPAITPFAWWASRWGLAPLWGLALVVVLGAWLARARSAQSSKRRSPLPFGME